MTTLTPRARVSPDKVADILDNAAVYLLEHGWHQGQARGPGGSRCMSAALRAVCDGSLGRRLEWSTEAMEAVRRHLGLGHRKPESLPGWNDHPSRTLDEVLDALQETAKLVRTGDIEVNQ
jgi:hypothetical protein